MHYGVDFELPSQQSAELLVFIQSRYYAGYPRFEISTETLYLQKTTLENSLILGCLGAISLLAIYNFFIGVWIRDRSYLYYSAYLTTSAIAWAAAFNAIGEWFNFYSYSLLIPPFFLTNFFNILYYIHFLDLKKYNPNLTHLSYLLAAFSALMFFSYPLFSPGSYMLVYALSCTFWVVLGLSCGIVRLRNGYKPARFFVAAFGVVFVGSIASVLPIFGISHLLFNHYLLTLLAQTADILLLALALADRIRILRMQKEQALELAYDTEVRSTETEREANVKLQEALSIAEQESQRKSDFLRMVSHELRTPLHSIVSSTEQWNELEDDAGRGDLIHYISYGAARLRSQVDNLVLLAETDDMQLKPIVAAFEIRPILDKLCESMQGLLLESVRFSHPREDGLPAAFQGDAYLLEHLLRSVLENACKYTEQGSVEFVINWDAEESLLDVHIIDSGCGMTDAQQSVMFNDFVQVSRGLDRKSEGLGLGLTICYRLSEIMGADFNIRSELGVGTEVNIRLPLENLPDTLSLVVTAMPKRGKVLVVEDNLVNAQVLKKIVRRLGFQVDISLSGQDALAILADKVYDIILMDIQMPVMDGITATRWIRQRGITTPIIAVTANSDANVRKRCIDVGMNDLLVKPVRRADIQRVVERQFRKSKAPEA